MVKNIELSDLLYIFYYSLFKLHYVDKIISLFLYLGIQVFILSITTGI